MISIGIYCKKKWFVCPIRLCTEQEHVNPARHNWYRWHVNGNHCGKRFRHFLLLWICCSIQTSSSSSLSVTFEITDDISEWCDAGKFKYKIPIVLHHEPSAEQRGRPSLLCLRRSFFLCSLVKFFHLRVRTFVMIVLRGHVNGIFRSRLPIFAVDL